MNAKRVYRLYPEMGLQLRNKTPRRRLKAELRNATVRRRTDRTRSGRSTLCMISWPRGGSARANDSAAASFSDGEQLE